MKLSELLLQRAREWDVTDTGAWFRDPDLERAWDFYYHDEIGPQEDLGAVALDAVPAGKFRQDCLEHG